MTQAEYAAAVRILQRRIREKRAAAGDLWSAAVLAMADGQPERYWQYRIQAAQEHGEHLAYCGDTNLTDTDPVIGAAEIIGACRHD